MTVSESPAEPLGAGESHELRLTVQSGPPLADIEIPPGQSASLGRSSQRTIRLDHRAVSRHHANVSYRDGAWVISDAASRLGTRVNGVLLAPDERVPLTEGDRISIGPWTFRVGSVEKDSRSTLQTFDDPIVGAGLTLVRPGSLGALAEERLGLLIEAARAMQRSPDEASVASCVAEVLLRGTGFGRVLVVRPVDGMSVLEVLASAPGALAGGSRPTLSRSMLMAASAGEVSRLGDGVADESHSIQSLGLTDAICAPVRVGEGIDAFIYMDCDVGHGRPHPDATAFCMALADVLGLALSNVHRMALESRQRRLLRDLDVARDAQRRLMPATSGRLGAVNYRYLSVPGWHVAGDLFGVVRHGSRSVAFLGDVCGKGLGAGVLMATVQSHLMALLGAEMRIDDIAGVVNDFVAERAAGGEFVTLWIAAIDPESGTMECVDAGHGYAVLVDADGVASRLICAGGPPLGVAHAHRYEVSRTALPAHGRLVLFSDGVAEQASSSGQRMGFPGVLAALKGAMSVEEDVRRLHEALVAHGGGEAFEDDVTIASLGIAT